VAVIRDPLERAISNWKNKMWDQADNGRQREKWKTLGFTVRSTFEEYLDQLQPVLMKDGHIKPQVNHLPLQVDYMLNMGEMKEQWSQLQSIYPWLPDLPMRNVTQYEKENLSDYLTESSEKLLRQIYAKDFSLYESLQQRREGLHDLRILQKTLSGNRGGQQQFEIDSLAYLFAERGVRSYLEVGARYGDSFYDVMRRLPVGSKGVCVDFPGNVWGTAGSSEALEAACEKLRKKGYNITIILGDSTDPRVVKEVERLGPFDAALLDGDHRYNGIKKDFENYASLCGIVALHDIVGHGQRHSEGIEVEVPKFWREIKTKESVEFIAPGSAMGIGVVWNT
jgi:hypothetical protein